MLLKIKRTLAKLWPVTIRRFSTETNLLKNQLQVLELEIKKCAENRNAQDERQNKKSDLISRQITVQTSDILTFMKSLQLEMEIQSELRSKKEEELLSAFQGLKEELSTLNNRSNEQIEYLQKFVQHINERELDFRDIRTKFDQSLMSINEVKATAENNNRYIMETLWAEIFNSTTLTSKDTWLRDKTFSPGRKAVGYQYLYVMYRILGEAKPKKILELGLGQSTRMISQYAATHEDVEHIIIEHDNEWAQFFGNHFNMPICSKIEITDIDMVPYKNAETVRVYKDLSKKLSGKKFDFISIDAPLGGDMPQYARIDVLQMLPDCLSENFVIMFDDCNRTGERRTLQEMESCLKKHNIAYKRGKYRGIKDVYVLVAEHMKFLTTM